MYSTSTNTIFRILIFVIISASVFYLLMCNVKAYGFKGLEILNVLISASSIILAIVVTFLFSKLFTENSIRIDRKKEIDELSIKITYLRRIAYHIRQSHEFWKFNGINAKATIDRKYETLSYEDYRAGISKFTYDEWVKIDEDIYGTTGQAYLALKGLEDGENTFAFYAEVNPRNYSLNDIGRYKVYVNSFWYMLDKSDDEIVNFSNVNSYWMESIDELYFKITGKLIDKTNYKSEIKNLFSEFESVIFNKHYYRTLLNTNTPSTLKSAFGSMLVFVLIVISCLILYILNIDGQIGMILVLLIASTFIANTLDLIILTLFSIRKELDVNEIFRI